jgi:hypothetical protein
MIWCPNHDQNDNDPLERGIPRFRKEGIKLLGAPVGSQDFMEEVLKDRIIKLEALMDKLHLLEDPNTEYGILRKCFSLPKLSYTMRTVDPRPSLTRLLGRTWNEFWGSPCWTTSGCTPPC